MNPWTLQWAPHLQFPFGGNVAQDYRPSTDWLFGSIKSEAGNGHIEETVFSDVASYGKQLGLITEVLADLAAQMPPTTTKGAKSFADPKEIQAKIEKVKAIEYGTDIDDLEQKILAIQQRGGPDSEKQLSRLRALLAVNAD